MKNLTVGLGSKEKLRVVGLMSGTSADGVDVAFVDIDGWEICLAAFDTIPYSPAMKKEILSLCRPETARLDRLCHCNHMLGEFFADAILAVCVRNNVPLGSIDLIGSHGQTVFHNPKGRRYRGRTVRSTLQIGEPSAIAQRTGITTVADFRPRDMAAGGQGAPLVPFADYMLFRDRRCARAIQNIGGIANVTFLPRACGRSDVIAFDTGPGNMIIDGVMRWVSNGKRHYDRRGAMAARGKVDQDLLKEMLRHPFFRRRPPKSTGREEFGQSYCDGFCRKARDSGLTPEGMVATATAFTAESIARAYGKFLPAPPDEMILCGGGWHNETLREMLRDRLAGVRIRSTDEFGISVDAREAVAFALLAVAAVRGVANNIPAATGADEPVVMGKIIPGR